MINFLHTFEPQPIMVSLGLVQIHWYGFLVVLGIILAIYLALKFCRFFSILPDQVFDVAFYVIIFGFLGARIYAVFLDLNYYLSQPWEILAVWHGGLAIHGAIFGGLLAALIYSWYKKQSFWSYADLGALSLPLAQAIGRWGNYFNQEVFGRPSNLPWSIPIEIENRPFDYLNYQYFTPTFLYESILNILNFIVLFLLFKYLTKRKLKLPGFLFLSYLINYSLIRMAMEFWRIDQTPLVLGWRFPIIVSLILIIFSLALIVKKIKVFKKI